MTDMARSFYARTFEVRIIASHRKDLWTKEDLLAAILESECLSGVNSVEVVDTMKED